MSDKPHFCVDCKWWYGLADEAKPDVIVNHLCLQPVVNGPYYDPVTGAEFPAGQHTCSVQRLAQMGKCGPEGVLWEPRS